MLIPLLTLCASMCAFSVPTVSSSPVELDFPGNGSVVFRWRSDAAWEQRDPIALELVDNNGKATWLKAGYSSIKSLHGSVRCIGAVKSANGTRFCFTDIYKKYDKHAFILQRRVTVENPAKADAAFSTRFTLSKPGASGLDSLDVLAPGVWYGQNSHVPRHAIGGDKSDSSFFFREDRLAAPFIMAMDRSSKLTLTIAHSSPDPQTFAGEDFLPRLIDERMQFGSLGFEKTSPAGGIEAGFLFPGTEGEKTYIAGGSKEKRWAYRSHPVKAGVRHSYNLIIRLDEYADYPSAVRETWRYCYGIYKPGIVKADLKKVYADGVDLLFKYARQVNGASGFPFSIKMNGEAEIYCYQMGFVGAQVQGAYHLFRNGVLKDKPEQRKLGEDIINFWVRESYDGRSGANDLPHTWYQPAMPPGSGLGPHWGQMKTEKFWRDEPLNGQVFLRTLSEGHLAALRAWELGHRRGVEHEDWLQWAKRYGNWLVKHQNSDGSYYRKYAVTGEPMEQVKDCTTHPIPFLVELCRATGEHAYLEAAIKAGNFAWKYDHETCNYVGGTPDNPNVPDKEAVQIALAAFLDLYNYTRDIKWLEASKRAADFLETWVYIWDIPMAQGDKGFEVFDRINTTGLSLVATGHSYSDYADASSAHHFWRLYMFTKDAHYRDFARLLLFNTKQLLDTDGSKGHGHPGLQVEGIGLSVLRGRGAKVWLPWVTMAQIDPISQFEDAGDSWD